jgi:hypothetical protein
MLGSYPLDLKGYDMNRLTLTRRFSGLALAAMAFPNLAFAAPNLAPHRAYYTLEAMRLDDQSGMTGIQGRLAYEITGNECDGYSISYRIANRYVQGEGDAQTMDIQLTSFESGDGLELDMKEKQFINDKLEKETRVKAKMPKAGGPGEGSFEGKEGRKFDIDPAAIFPTAFQKQLMTDAEQGKQRTSSMVFEGSDDAKVVKAITFIGNKKANNKIVAGADAATLSALSKLPSWPVTVSYFELGSPDDTPPNYSASFNMLSNGVSTDLVLDYGAYALKGKLEKIEMLETAACK